MSVLRTCGVPGHPKLTPEQQSLPQFYDGASVIESIVPGSKIRLSNADRVLHRLQPTGIPDRLVLLESKNPGEGLSNGERYLHEAFQTPTLAMVLHVVYRGLEAPEYARGIRYGLVGEW